jgi:hypothetical protein
MNDWNIQSRAHICAACGRNYTDRESFHTLLFDEKQDFRRMDVCEACWQKQFSDGARERKGFISYWQGVYHAPVPATEAIQKDTAETLLRKLIVLNDKRFEPAAYILAVMLERKRLLKVKEQPTRDGHRFFIYEHPGSGDIFTIIDPELQLNQLEDVQRDVAMLLEHGLPQTDTPAVAVATPAAPDTAIAGSPGVPAVAPT